MLKIPFPNPPFELQQKIGKILSTYDLLIENYQRQIEEAKKQVVWKMIHTS
ncbi:restriction endonuclease subunit S [Candidatus Mycoplasma haematobovis]|uniref:restriction endonuclease subunit S n=1 Tax=Candidatus Mycoplasma haematobovis TaxID=432608 RepID=UPI00351D5730